MNLEIGLGVLSVVIAGVAVWIAVSSDKKMKAIANLEFDEKRAMIELHRNNLSQTYNQSHFDRLLCVIEALGHVARYADRDKRKWASQEIDNIIKLVQNHVPKDTINRLTELSSMIRG